MPLSISPKMSQRKLHAPHPADSTRPHPWSVAKTWPANLPMTSLSMIAIQLGSIWTKKWKKMDVGWQLKLWDNFSDNSFLLKTQKVEWSPSCLGFCNTLSQEKSTNYGIWGGPQRREISLMILSMDPHLSLRGIWVFSTCLMKNFKWDSRHLWLNCWT